MMMVSLVIYHVIPALFLAGISFCLSCTQIADKKISGMTVVRLIVHHVTPIVFLAEVLCFIGIFQIICTLR